MEITARDLRIGNYVMAETAQSRPYITEVIAIEKERIIVKINKENGIVVRKKPIPLTQEWLLNFGFEEVDYAGACYNLGIVSIDTADFNCVVNGKCLDVKIQYVHQLQNLYHALTQTELTLTK